MKHILSIFIKLAAIPMVFYSCLFYSCNSFAGRTNDIINRERLRRDEIVKKVEKEMAAESKEREEKNSKNSSNGKKRNKKDNKKYRKAEDRKDSEKSKRNKKNKKSAFERYKKLSEQQIQNYQGLIKKIKRDHTRKMQQNRFFDFAGSSNLTNFVKPVPQAVIFVSFSMPSLSLKQIIRDASRYQVPIVMRGLYENSFRKTVEKVFGLVKENNKGGILINPLWFRKYDIKVVPAVVVNDSGNIVLNDKNNFDVIYGNIPLKEALKLIVDRGSVSKAAEMILARGGV